MEATERTPLLPSSNGFTTIHHHHHDSSTLNSSRNILNSIQHWFYHCILFLDKHDDMVSVSTKKLVLVITLVLSLWTWSYILVMLEIIEECQLSSLNNENNTNKLSQEDWLLFLPMWIGSTLGILLVCHISYRTCHNVRLTSRERRLFALSHSEQVTPSSFTTTQTQQNNNNNNNHTHLLAEQHEQSHPPDTTMTLLQYIDFDSLPLMRRLIGWIIAMVFALIIALITQIIYYLWFIQDVVGVWHAGVPTFFLLLCYMIYMYLVTVFDLWSCLTYTCLVIALILFTFKNDQSKIHHWPWWIISIPFLMAMTSCLVYYGRVVYHALMKKVLLDGLQMICLFIYLMTILHLSTASCLVIIDEQYPLFLVHKEDLPYCLWLIAVPAFMGAVLAILLKEGHRLAHSRGFTKPLLLSKTQAGWEVTPSGNDITLWLLGNARTPPFTLPPLPLHPHLSQSVVGQQEGRLKSSSLDRASNVEESKEIELTSKITTSTTSIMEEA